MTEQEDGIGQQPIPPPPELHAEQPPRWRRWPLILGGVLLVGLIFFGVWLVIRVITVTEEMKYKNNNVRAAFDSDNAPAILRIIKKHPGIVRYHGYAGESTLLQLAIYAGKPRVSHVLITHGSSLTYRDARGVTAMGYAVDGNHEEMVLDLLSHGVKSDGLCIVSRKNPALKYVPLQRSAELGLCDISVSLIKHGANVNYFPKDSLGSPIALLIANCPYPNRHPDRHKEFMKTLNILLDNGADPNGNDADGVSLLKLVIGRNDLEMIALLKAHGAKR